jgi:hypothetical protein
MIFYLDGEPLVSGVERRPFGNSPGFEDAAYFEAQVVVEPCCCMLLNDKYFVVFASLLPARFRGLRKAAFSPIFREFSHSSHYSAPDSVIRSKMSWFWGLVPVGVLVFGAFALPSNHAISRRLKVLPYCVAVVRT